MSRGYSLSRGLCERGLLWQSEWVPKTGLLSLETAVVVVVYLYHCQVGLIPLGVHQWVFYNSII